jgi:hypothetical protein
VCSTTFIFKVRWGSIQIFGVFRFQIGTLWNRSTPGRDVVRPHPTPCRLGVRAARAFPRPRAFPRAPRAPKRLEVHARHAPGRRSRRTAPSVNPFAAPSPCARTYRGRRRTTAGIFVIHSSQASECHLFKRSPLPRARPCCVARH